jgi:hypothetical protein
MVRRDASHIAQWLPVNLPGTAASRSWHGFMSNWRMFTDQAALLHAKNGVSRDDSKG